MSSHNYLLICLGISIAISFDVLFATLLRLNSGLTIRHWALPIALTHTVFPACSFSIAWTLGQIGSLFTIAVNFAGFVLISLFLYEEFSEKIGVKPKFAIANWIEERFNFGKKQTANTLVILSISWDSLLFGPSFVATASTEGWSIAETYLAFIFIGGCVFFITITLILSANAILRRVKSDSRHAADQIGLTHYFTDILSFSAIGSFGVLSLLRCFFSEASLLLSAIISFIIWGTLFYLYRRTVIQTEHEEAIHIASE